MINFPKPIFFIICVIFSQAAFSQTSVEGQCIAYLYKEGLARGGVNNIDPPYKRYWNKNQASIDAIFNTLKKHPNCTTANTDLESCLKKNSVNSNTIKLVLGFNTGLTLYKDNNFRQNASRACAE
jgi:hypothetical protein